MRYDDYYIWLIKKVDDNDHCILSNYRFLLDHLYNTEFIWWFDMDQNRAGDGLYLRTDFVRETGIQGPFVRHLGGACSLLEMMVALAKRCEEEYMGDPLIEEDYTSKWFWYMVRFLELEGETDDNFDEFYFYQQMDRLFCKDDSLTLFGMEPGMKDMQIWDQLMRFLTETFFR